MDFHNQKRKGEGVRVMVLLDDDLKESDCGVIALSDAVCTMNYVRLTINGDIMRC